MPTILTHPAVPLAVGLGLGAGIIPVRLLIAGVIVSILPDLDVVAFHLGFPYAHDLGHRGATHSLLFAVIIALLGSMAISYFKASISRTFSFLLLAASCFFARLARCLYQWRFGHCLVLAVFICSLLRAGASD